MRVLVATLLALLVGVAVAQLPTVPDVIIVPDTTKIPGGFVWDAERNTFIVSTEGNGNLYRVNDLGELELFAESSVAPFFLLQSTQRMAYLGDDLWVANMNMTAVRSGQFNGGSRTATMIAFDRQTGEPRTEVDVTPGHGQRAQVWLQGVAARPSDPALYVADALGGRIIRVHSQGTSDVFYEWPGLLPRADEPMGATAIAIDPVGDAYMLVSLWHGELVKLPFAFFGLEDKKKRQDDVNRNADCFVEQATKIYSSNPRATEPVSLTGLRDIKFDPTDPTVLWGVQGTPYGRVVRLHSTDEWATAHVVDTFETGFEEPIELAFRTDGNSLERGDPWTLHDHFTQRTGQFELERCRVPASATPLPADLVRCDDGFECAQPSRFAFEMPIGQKGSDRVKKPFGLEMH